MVMVYQNVQFIYQEINVKIVIHYIILKMIKQNAFQSQTLFKIAYII